jgi:cytochrome oxidase assembly protein ShyY1
MLAETSPGSDDLPGSATAAPEPAAPTVQTADVPFPLQNFFYAFQWWIFAAFAVVVYLRWLWLDAAGQAQVAAGEPDRG